MPRGKYVRQNATSKSKARTSATRVFNVDEDEDQDILATFWTQENQSPMAPKTRGRKPGSNNKKKADVSPPGVRKSTRRKTLAALPQTEAPKPRRGRQPARKSMPAPLIDESPFKPKRGRKSTSTPIQKTKVVKQYKPPAKVFDSAYYYRENIDRMEKYYKARLEAGMGGPEINIRTGEIYNGDIDDIDEIQIGELAESREARAIQQKAFRKRDQVPLWNTLDKSRNQFENEEDTEDDDYEESNEENVCLLSEEEDEYHDATESTIESDQDPEPEPVRVSKRKLTSKPSISQAPKRTRLSENIVFQSPLHEPTRNNPASNTRKSRELVLASQLRPTSPVKAPITVDDEAQIAAIVRGNGDSNTRRWYDMRYQLHCLEDYREEIREDETELKALLALVMTQLDLVFPCLPDPLRVIPVIRFDDKGDISIEMRKRDLTQAGGAGDSSQHDDPDCGGLLNYSSDMMALSKEIYLTLYAYAQLKSTRRESGGEGNLNLVALQQCGLDFQPDTRRGSRAKNMSLGYRMGNFTRNASLLAIEY